MIDCTGSGQDADFRSGVSWPAPRFELLDDVVVDRLTGLVWTRNANMAEFPLAWQEALDFSLGGVRSPFEGMMKCSETV